jgi:hypothetical protein
MRQKLFFFFFYTLMCVEEKELFEFCHVSVFRFFTTVCESQGKLHTIRCLEWLYLQVTW